MPRLFLGPDGAIFIDGLSQRVLAEDARKDSVME
jgi:hypothetical protein